MKHFERVYPWLLAAPVILPVIIWGWPLTAFGTLLFPYLVPKTLLFYALTFITLGAFLLLAANGRAFYWNRLAHKETWIPAALLLLAYTSSVFGIDFYRSFWSLFSRGDGLLMLSCAVASFYLILLHVDRAFFDRLLRAVAMIGTFVAIYGVFEAVSGGGRIGSLLGNAGFFAGYLAIAFLATLAAAGVGTRGWRTFAHVGAAVQLLAIILSATRGTMLALSLSGVAYLAYTACARGGEVGAPLSRAEPRAVIAEEMRAKKRRVWSLRALIALIVIGGLFFAFRGALSHSSFTPVARIASIGTNDPDVASRLFIWKNMVAEIAKSPWQGVGAEHIDVLFNRFYNPAQIGEEWFDRSHNAFLDYAAQYGVFGLLLYIALIATLLTSAWRLKQKGERRLAGMLALLALAYAIQNFFIFDTISSFWLFLALIASGMGLSFKDAAPQVISLPSWTRLASGVCAFTLVLLIIPVCILPGLANYDLAQAYAYGLADAEMSTQYLAQAFALGTYGNLEIGNYAYDLYANVQAASLSGDVRLRAYQASLAILSANFTRYPYDERTALDLAHVLSLAPEGTPADKNLLSSALERAMRLSPKRSQPWYILANLSISDANTHPPKSPERVAGYAAARDILTRYIALVPTLAEPYYALAGLDVVAGDTTAAAEEAAKGKLYYTSNIATARRAAAYYVHESDWQNARFFLREVVRLAPADYASLYDLAKVEFLMGDKAAAEDIVVELRASDPAILETDTSFFSAITAYESQVKQ